METATRPETAYARPPPAPLTHLLASYTTHNPLRSPSPLPASSRVDPSRAQRAAPPYSSPLFWTIPTWIAFIRFALAKGLHIIWSLISHFVFGPKRPSWGYRMTFITSFMRNVADHSSLADVVLIRRLFSLQTMLPVPSDAVVTPITFIVPLRQGGEAARGFLKEWDELETGTRELTGEWVVGVDVWKRLKAERRARLQAERKRYTASPLSEMNTTASTSAAQIPGTAAYFANRPGQRQRTTSAGSGSGMGTGSHSRSGRYTPSNDSDTESSMTARKGFAGERVIYYIHGGAYYVGNAATHRLITIGISKACNARVFGECLSLYHKLPRCSVAHSSHHIPPGARAPIPSAAARRSARLPPSFDSSAFNTSGKHHRYGRLGRWRVELGAVPVSAGRRVYFARWIGVDEPLGGSHDELWKS